MERQPASQEPSPDGSGEAPEEFLTGKEVVGHSSGKVSAGLIYRLVKRRALPSVQIGGKVLMPRSGLTALSLAAGPARGTEGKAPILPSNPLQ
jgi:hypothetical protein